MKRIVDDYDQAIKVAWHDIVAKADCGDQSCKERVATTVTQDFVWKLLKSSAIERMGRSNHHQSELAQKISQMLDVPPDVTEREIARLVGDGNLTYDRATQGEHAAWRWT